MNRYDMIWYDMIWYDMIWYDMIWYVWYDISDMILQRKQFITLTNTILYNLYEHVLHVYGILLSWIVL